MKSIGEKKYCMKPITKATYSIYWKHLKRHRLLALLVAGCIGLGSLLNLLPAFLYREFFNIVTGDVSPLVAPQLFDILWKILGLYLLSWLVWRAGLFANTAMQVAVVRDLSQSCFHYVHGHAATFFHNTFVGSLVKKINKFGYAFERIADLIIFHWIRIVVDVTFILIVLFFKSWILGLILTGWIILMCSMNYFFSLYKLKFDARRTRQDSLVTGLLADTVTNHSNIKLLSGTQREQKKFNQETSLLAALKGFAWNLSEMFESVQVLITILLEFLIMSVAVHLWQKGQIVVGDFILIQTYILVLMRQLWDIGRYIRDYYEYLAEAEEMAEILTTPHEIQDVREATELSVSKGEIVFDRVDFAYNQTRDILGGFDLHIAAGERVALVGHSGAGKSTIIKLLLRDHDVTGGEIRIDDQSISQATRASLWASLSYVPQEPMLFHRSLIENIRYGRPDASDEEVFAAAKQARAHDFITEFPDGYETLVGERGVKLSGGERQRVAIARAILRNAPILILDEATSSLDSESELLIQEALDALMKNKTVIVVAHRLSTIMKMDRILVIEDGKIVEEGDHEALLKKKNGFYKRLWNIQAGQFIGE